MFNWSEQGSPGADTRIIKYVAHIVSVGRRVPKHPVRNAIMLRRSLTLHSNAYSSPKTMTARAKANVKALQVFLRAGIFNVASLMMLQIQ